eukprot:g19914.t1
MFRLNILDHTETGQLEIKLRRTSTMMLRSNCYRSVLKSICPSLRHGNREIHQRMEWKKCVISLRSQKEMWQENERLRYSIESAHVIDFSKSGRNMLADGPSMVLSDITNAHAQRSSEKLDTSVLAEKLHTKALQQERPGMHKGAELLAPNLPRNLLLKAEIEGLRAAADAAEPRTPRNRQKQPERPRTVNPRAAHPSRTNPRAADTEDRPGTAGASRTAGARGGRPGAISPRSEATGGERPRPATHPRIRPGASPREASKPKVVTGALRARVPVAEPRGRNAPRVLRTSQLCAAGETISKLCDQLHFWRGQSQDVKEELQQSLARKSAGTVGAFAHSLDVRLERRSALARRVRTLREELSSQREGLELLQQQLHSGAAPSRRRPTDQGLQACSMAESTLLPPADFAAAQDAKKPLGVVSFCQFAWLWGLGKFDGSTAPARGKLHEVRQVYPLQQCSSYWTIRGISLRGTESLRHQDPLEEHEASTALGFLGHILVSVAALLQVPLQLELKRAGSSRCFLVDLHETPEAPSRAFLPLPKGGSVRKCGEWPLHYSRVEKSHFDMALKLLEDSLHQFLYSRGYLSHRKLYGGNLLKCADAIFSHEIYGDESRAL